MEHDEKLVKLTGMVIVAIREVGSSSGSSSVGCGWWVRKRMGFLIFNICNIILVAK